MGSPQAKLYFAYGSNLHLRQMQRRCPRSKYIGSGRLPDFRWQINERGYANVVPANGGWVDGLVFEIDGSDEDRLDINEGVSIGAYEKQHMRVAVRLAPPLLYRRPVTWIVACGGPSAVYALARQSHDELIEMEVDGVLVYISSIYVSDGVPHEEYVQRINCGLKDSLILGMDDDYVRNCIRPFVPESRALTNETTVPTENIAPDAKERL
ncbi:AIG2 family protein [Moelleriella libera RCEF 2490]|uniref:gamma-glutamylcyclotransferase n=1 Tax=Moelleriella libera RCEF 2490 TaxID=1081109 RepID=A0A168C3N0_9HYPO|nr:AIG2 family protein [Moelleriella libera RCEF 2490]